MQVVELRKFLESDLASLRYNLQGSYEPRSDHVSAD